MTPRFTDHELLIRAQAVKPWREKVAELEAENLKLREALQSIVDYPDLAANAPHIARAALQKDEGVCPDCLPFKDGVIPCKKHLDEAHAALQKDGE